MPPKQSSKKVVECVQVYVLPEDEQQIDFEGNFPNNLFDTVQLVPLNNLEADYLCDFRNVKHNLKFFFSKTCIDSISLLNVIHKGDPTYIYLFIKFICPINILLETRKKMS